MLDVAKNIATQMVDTDPDLNLAENLPVKSYLQMQKGKTVWSKIS
jgi:ATP-dependent DNA helicase RecG